MCCVLIFYDILIFRKVQVDIMRGKVKNFNKEKGYGFIKTEEGKDVFFHYSELKMEGFKTVEANKTVEFEIIETEKGLRAVNIVVVE